MEKNQITLIRIEEIILSLLLYWITGCGQITINRIGSIASVIGLLDWQVVSH